MKQTPIVGATASKSASELLSSVDTLAKLLAMRAAQTPDGEAYRQFETNANQWVSYSWNKISTLVNAWCQSIATLQLPGGARVAILLPNGVNAICVDQASLAHGFVPVPMHAIDNPASIGYILNDSQASMLVLSTYEQWQAIAATCAQFPDLKLVLVTDTGATVLPVADKAVTAAPAVRNMQEWLTATASVNPTPTPSIAQAEDLAAIVYTSGTTGKPKGVMLTHHNIIANIKAVLGRVEARTDDVFLSFLPLSHTFERTIGYYLPIAAGSCVVYARSVALIAEDLKLARPTALVSVPRIYERFYAKMQEKLAHSSGSTQFLFKLAQRVGWRRFARAQGLPDGAQGSAFIDALLWPVLKNLVADTVMAQFGGRLRLAVSGGAPMSQAVAQCFLGLGVPMLQGYGMTETSPVVSANAIDDNWPTTVGKVLAGVEVRIGENNELQVRSESVMKGYWNRPEDTRNVMTDDGWLRTGDQAVIEAGRIRISGRLKEIMVTSTGEKVPPADLELAIMSNPLFEQAMVVGENRSFISAYVVLNKALWTDLARSLQLDPDADASLKATAARDVFISRIKEATKAFPYYAMPRAVWCTLEPWTIENGMITP
ncbi:MAG TPA: long-chain fatty acid--CoA ligase, partial [Burkholderiaceae bacterium]|nr:long-chain fatty acid--CoA ligase [Burkholderiaceae bacterium]